MRRAARRRPPIAPWRRLAATAGLTVLLGAAGCTHFGSAPPPAGPTDPVVTVSAGTVPIGDRGTVTTTDPAGTGTATTAADAPGRPVVSPPAVSPDTAEPTAAGPTAGSTSTQRTSAGPATDPPRSAEPTDGSGATRPPAGGFASTVGDVDDVLAARMTRSWRPGCPVALADLRYVTVSYRTPDGADDTGELVVAATVADDVVSVFHRLYDDGFPITSMRLVDDFGADDDASMAADNTSAFNCRPVTGGTGLSEHSYGTAVDVNPLQNPFVRGATVLPPAGADFVDRPDSPGVIHPGDATVAAFAAIGWSWGGDWTTPTDYQHFSLGGR